MSGINIKDVKISFGGTELTEFDSSFFTVDELNAGSEIDRIEHAIKYGMRKQVLDDSCAGTELDEIQRQYRNVQAVEVQPAASGNLV